MKYRVFLFIGILMTIIMILFLAYIFQHPEVGTVSYLSLNQVRLFYLVYFVSTILMYILAILFKIKG
jgi:hypothetical protein